MVPEFSGTLNVGYASPSAANAGTASPRHRARAERVYPPLTQTAFLLLSELCRYLPGLVKPFSLDAVVPPVHYDITASLLTIFHFVIAKGEDETAISTHCQDFRKPYQSTSPSQDLPLIYTSADGSGLGWWWTEFMILANIIVLTS